MNSPTIKQPIARYLDHAVLKPELTQAEAAEQIQVGIDHQVISVCVRPSDIAMAQRLCAGTSTDVSCVLNFPHGTALSASKTAEAELYIELGVREIDMVVNYGLLRCGLWVQALEDMRAVTSVARPAGVGVKVILETAMLDEPQIEQATRLAIEAEADFVKTSTGFSAGGATESAVATMLSAADGRIGVKASGGVRDRTTAERYLAMGCTRLGVGAASTPIICGEGGS